MPIICAPSACIRFYLWCLFSKLQRLKTKLRHFLTPCKIGWQLGDVYETQQSSIIDSEGGCFRFPISCSVLKSLCVKCDWSRKSRSNLLLFCRFFHMRMHFFHVLFMSSLHLQQTVTWAFVRQRAQASCQCVSIITDVFCHIRRRRAARR